MVCPLLRHFQTQAYDTDIPVPTALAFDEIPAFRCKTTPDDVVDLAGDAPETFRKIFSAQKNRIFIGPLEKLLDMPLDDVCEAGHGGTSFLT
jgi:hypothetical protein